LNVYFFGGGSASFGWGITRSLAVTTVRGDRHLREPGMLPAAG
jgi:hypothetical protein